jgi:hypothetical protein
MSWPYDRQVPIKLKSLTFVLLFIFRWSFLITLGIKYRMLVINVCIDCYNLKNKYVYVYFVINNVDINHINFLFL